MYCNYIFIDWPISRTETWCSIFIISASKIRWLSLSTFLSQCIIFSWKRTSLYVLPSCITTEYFFEWSRLFSTLHKLLAWFHLRLLDKGSNPNLHFRNIIISLFALCYCYTPSISESPDMRIPNTKSWATKCILFLYIWWHAPAPGQL